MDDISNWRRIDLPAHRRKVFCLAWNCDGSRLATGSQDKCIRIWRTDGDASKLAGDTKQDVELRGHEDSVINMRWHHNHPDRLASAASSERCIRFWDVRSRKNTATLSTPGQNLYLAWSADGNYMVVGNREDVVCCVDVRKMKIEAKHSHRYQVNELAFLGACGTPSRLLLQSTGNNNQVEVLQWPDYKRVATLRGHTAPVLSMGIDAAERYIATGGGDAVVGLWDAEDFICLRTYTQMDSSIRALCFSHDSRYLAMAGEDPSVFVEDVERGTSLGRVMLRGSAEDCAWHPKAHVLAYPIEIANAAHIEFRVPSQTEG